MARFSIALMSVALLAVGTNSVAADWVEGKHYSTLAQPQRTNVPSGKIEVMEVFSYGCPACNTFVPFMKKLQSSLPANAQIVYLPASWNKAEAWPMFQRAYLTALSLGVADKGHDAMFNAIWGPGGELAVVDPQTRRLKSRLPTIEDAARVYEKTTGVKAADFVTASKSFGVDLKIRQADSQILTMKVTSTPTLVVNGKYRVSNEHQLNSEQMIALVKFLVAKETR